MTIGWIRLPCENSGKSVWHSLNTDEHCFGVLMSTTRSGKDRLFEKPLIPTAIHASASIANWTPSFNNLFFNFWGQEMSRLLAEGSDSHRTWKMIKHVKAPFLGVSSAGNMHVFPPSWRKSVLVRTFKMIEDTLRKSDFKIDPLHPFT